MKFPDISQCEDPVFHIRGDGFTSKNRSPERNVDLSKDIVIVIPEGPEDQRGPLRQGQRNVCFKMHGTESPENLALEDFTIAEHQYHKNQDKFTITYSGLNRTPDQPGKKYEIKIRYDQYGQIICSWIMPITGRWRPANGFLEATKIKANDFGRRFTHSKNEVEEMRKQEREKVTVSKMLNIKFTCRERFGRFVLQNKPPDRLESNPPDDTNEPKLVFESQGEKDDHDMAEVMVLGEEQGLEITHVAFLAWIATLWISERKWVEHRTDVEYYAVEPNLF